MASTSSTDVGATASSRLFDADASGSVGAGATVGEGSASVGAGASVNASTPAATGSIAASGNASAPIINGVSFDTFASMSTEEQQQIVAGLQPNEIASLKRYCTDNVDMNLQVCELPELR